MRPILTSSTAELPDDNFILQDLTFLESSSTLALDDDSEFDDFSPSTYTFWNGSIGTFSDDGSVFREWPLRALSLPSEPEDNERVLSEEERKRQQAIVDRQLTIPDLSVSFFSLWRYASRLELVVLAISVAGALMSGAVLPLMTVVFGDVTGKFVAFFLSHRTTNDIATFKDDIRAYTLYFVYLAGLKFVTTYGATLGFIWTGENVTRRIRETYLYAILRQNMAIFDKLSAGEIATRITSEINILQDAISQKLCLTIAAVSTFGTAYIIGFTKSWKLTLVLTSAVAAMAIAIVIGAGYFTDFSKRSLESNGRGGEVVEESISSIRTAVAMNAQGELSRRYASHLKEIKRLETKRKGVLALVIGASMSILFLENGLSFWEGSRLVKTGDASFSGVITITQAMVMAAFALSNVAPNLGVFMSAMAVAKSVFAMIDRKPCLDPTSSSGDVLGRINGEIEFKNVSHLYPSRPDVLVLEDFSLKMTPGQTTALVGGSGSGKSTLVGLLQRFYEPVDGEILVDGCNIERFNLKWLRSQMAVVSQEPTLFAGTIKDNIKYGLTGTPWENSSEREQNRLIINAAREAFAHDFIKKLPHGYNTPVGGRGGLLSGGQKQRIAIARALVANPKILLLDEATSALDTKSEGIVQKALEAAARGRTTIVIAHRLSTIKGADNIVVMSKGRIVQQGDHAELMNQEESTYRLLVEAQQVQAQEDPPAQEEYDDEIILKAKNSVKRRQSDRINRFNSTRSGRSIRLDEEREKKLSWWKCIRFVASFNREDKGLVAAGLMLSVICGSGTPVQSVLFSKSVIALSLSPGDINFWSVMFLALGIGEFVAFSLQGLIVAIAADRLVFRARDRAFRRILSKEMEFFDQSKNSPSALTSLLASETAFLAGLSGQTAGTLLMAMTMLIESIAISISMTWKLGLVATSTVPILFGCGFLSMWILSSLQTHRSRLHTDAAGQACEAISGIRTVASLGREHQVWQEYHDALALRTKQNLKAIVKFSAIFAASESASLLCIGLAFWYGGQIMSKGEVGLLEFFLSFTSIIFGAQAAGQAFSFADDMSKSRSAAIGLQVLFKDHLIPQSERDCPSIANSGNSDEPWNGTSLEFQDVHFAYPTRPRQAILRGLSLRVEAGQRIALVGPSGSGKSTVIQLIEGFYHPKDGHIRINGSSINNIPGENLRNRIGLVAQEPTLYSGSIRENILLGFNASEEMLIQACKDAAIYEFILSLPDGFQTMVGPRGSMLSGGQRQRIAIARALVRNPEILLLDEATAALDSSSEKAVQEALNRASQGRTTIAIAHRLSTVQDSDIIFVLDGGRVVEQGTHNELLALNGVYSELARMQSFGI